MIWQWSERPLNVPSWVGRGSTEYRGESFACLVNAVESFFGREVVDVSDLPLSNFPEDSQRKERSHR